jgi:hypothetical protein
MGMQYDGGPAFPSAADQRRECGVTLRDWFAGQALTGMLASGNRDATLGTVEDAYACADLMLYERQKHYDRNLIQRGTRDAD